MKKRIICVVFVLIVAAFIFYKRESTADIRILSERALDVSTATAPNSLHYTDGTYTGDVADAYWGNIQVEAVIVDGKLSEVRVLDYPADRLTSERINEDALPVLISEAIQTQNALVDIVSGATNSSLGFQQSLDSALAQAR